MIDTIKFRVPLTPDMATCIRSRSISTQKRDIESGETLYQFYNKDIPLGSYDRKINIFFFDDDFLYLEFSLPKFYYGHNVYLLYPEKIIPAITHLCDLLSDYFGAFPDWSLWSIQRLDLCYSWKFQTQAQAESILSVLRSFEFGKKTKLNYSSSVMLKGTTYSLKFYLKNDEYYRHDFKVLHKNPKLFDLAYNLLDVSSGVLRFEVTIRKTQLKKVFGKEQLFVKDIIGDILQDKLKYYLSMYLKHSSGVLMTSTEVLQKLLDNFSKTRAIHIWQFYELYHDKNPEKRQLMLKKYDRATVWRYMSDLSSVGVGLPCGDVSKAFELSIPSDYVVNFPDSFGG